MYSSGYTLNLKISKAFNSQEYLNLRRMRSSFVPPTANNLYDEDDSLLGFEIPPSLIDLSSADEKSKLF